ncbi:hypothetical protein ACH5RR_028494 [Cinchona calisaya]|uniref:Uncharacterized protein n=1 Tax=Cinchona calisaya TaxID=153742 RepID=A0ABD2YQ68_9GENT
MASTRRVDSVLHDLEFVLNDLKLLKVYISVELGCYDVRKLMLNLQCLETFLLYARKWSSNYLYLELADDKKVDFPSFLSSISDTVNLLSFLSSIRRTGNHPYVLSSIENSVDKNGMDETEMDDSFEDSLLLTTVLSKFSKKMKSFKLEIIKVYKTLLHYSSLQSSCWMSADELVGFIDSIL